MSDLLLYATTLENNRLRDAKIAAVEAKLPSTDIKWTNQLAPCDSGTFVSSATDMDDTPTFLTQWQTCLSPIKTAMDAKANSIKVCDSSGNYRCGCNCAFTVPAGVSTLSIQMWAPGTGTSTVCCCGGAPFGPSGAFAMFDLSVTAGESMVFCAGCAYCCYAYQTTPGITTVPSYVCYCGATNSGRIQNFTPIPCFCQWNCDMFRGGLMAPINASICLANPATSVACLSACSGWNFCWDTGADGINIPYLFSSCNYLVTDTSGSGFSSLAPTIYGIPGIWPQLSINTNNLATNPSYSRSPPVFGFESLTCCENYASGSTCSGCCRSSSNGIQRGPGFGGYASSAHGGCNACGGDSGGMGMICVTWNCD